MSETTYQSGMQVAELDMNSIYVDSEFNCRGAFTHFEVMELAKDIEEHGLLQPVLVVPYDKDGYNYKLIAGFRRYKAMETIKRLKIPAVIKNNLTETQQRAINLVENLQRKNLNILQEAIGIKNMIDAGCYQHEIADYLGVSTGWLNPRLKLLTLPEEIQKEAAAGFINTEHILDLVKIDDPEKQIKIVKDIKNQRELGNKRRIKIIEKETKLKPENQRKIRGVTDIFKLQSAIREAIGNGLATRVLAWCAGEIDDYEVYKSLKKEADNKGIYYAIPEEFQPKDDAGP